MTSLRRWSLRLGVISALAALLAAGTCGEAAAKVHKGRPHARGALYASHAELVAQPPARLGPMRYYGGPKSPMWREVR